MIVVLTNPEFDDRTPAWSEGVGPPAGQCHALRLTRLDRKSRPGTHLSSSGARTRSRIQSTVLLRDFTPNWLVRHS